MGNFYLLIKKNGLRYPLLSVSLLVSIITVFSSGLGVPACFLYHHFSSIFFHHRVLFFFYFLRLLFNHKFFLWFYFLSFFVSQQQTFDPPVKPTINLFPAYITIKIIPTPQIFQQYFISSITYFSSNFPYRLLYNIPVAFIPLSEKISGRRGMQISLLKTQSFASYQDPFRAAISLGGALATRSDL